ncbi:hypothetical protein TA3x_003753 [Tundrisphaera sp. TA3]|uniref:hypothetical protein n=1 Tax=Tundrisphaera sp. TA3 TaxID=3435775 RepID=UPI003EBBB8ED
MADFADMLRSIAKQPGMYVGRASIRAVSHYLDGYGHSLKDAGHAVGPLDGWMRWIERRFLISHPGWHWSRILLHAYRSDMAAIEALPGLYEEFLADRARLGVDGIEEDGNRRIIAEHGQEWFEPSETMTRALGDESDTIDGLLTALDSPDPRRRGDACFLVRDLAETIVASLFLQIARPENRNHRGSLVYTLKSFHCEGRFVQLFDLALNGNYEVQCHALSILEGQSFSVTREQLGEAAEALGRLRERENLPAEDVGLLRVQLHRVLSRLEESANDADEDD